MLSTTPEEGSEPGRGIFRKVRDVLFDRRKFGFDKVKQTSEMPVDESACDIVLKKLTVCRGGLSVTSRSLERPPCPQRENPV